MVGCLIFPALIDLLVSFLAHVTTKQIRTSKRGTFTEHFLRPQPISCPLASKEGPVNVGFTIEYPGLRYRTLPATEANKPNNLFDVLAFLAMHIIHKLWIKIQIKRYFTGDLESHVPGYPPFPGTENILLRAQIARITAGVCVSPAGFFEVDEEAEPASIKVGPGVGFSTPTWCAGAEILSRFVE